MSKALARLLNFVLPSGDDYLREGDDAITNNAVIAAALHDLSMSTYGRLRVRATGLPAGSAPTAGLTDRAPNLILELGIPAGADGISATEALALVDRAEAAEAAAASSAAAAAQAERAVFAEPDSAVAALFASLSSSTTAALEAAIDRRDAALAGTVHVERVRQPGDDDAAAWQRAIDTAATFGARTVLGGPRRYRFARPVAWRHSVALRGDPAGTTIISGPASGTCPVAFELVQGHPDARDLLAHGLTFDSEMTPMTGKARDARAWAAGRLDTAIRINGDRIAGAGGILPRVTNVTVTGCTFLGLKELPVFLSGIRGRTTFRDNHVERCLDSGFTFCEAVDASHNRVIYSADNGLSLSRGNYSVTAVGNHITGSWFSGLWIGGWPASPSGSFTIPATPGPEIVTLTANTIDNSGYAGIWAGGGPRSGAIVGNIINGVTRGSTENVDDLGVGIIIRGFDSDGVNDFASADVLAANLIISGNALIDCRRGGIAIHSATNITVIGNLILRPGMPYLVDGVTPSTPGQGSHAFGVACPGANTTGWGSNVSNIAVIGNYIIDDRAQPSTQWGTYHPNIPTWQDRANIVRGSIQPYNETLTLSALDVLGSGTLARLGAHDAVSTSVVIRGKAGASRQLVITDGGAGPTDPDTNLWSIGTAAGDPNLEIARWDNGTRTRVAVIPHASPQVRFDVPPRPPAMARSALPAPATYGYGIAIATDLRQLVFCDGANWRDAMGNVV